MAVEEQGVQPVLVDAAFVARLANPPDGPARRPPERRTDGKVEVVVRPDVGRAAFAYVDRPGGVLHLSPGRSLLCPEVVRLRVRPLDEVPGLQAVQSIGAVPQLRLQVHVHVVQRREPGRKAIVVPVGGAERDWPVLHIALRERLPVDDRTR